MSQFVKGKCPLCGSGVFVASGDWLTCSGSTCSDPTFVSEIFARYSDARAQLATLEARVERAKAAFTEASEVADWALDQFSRLAGWGNPTEARILAMYDRLIKAKESLAILEGDTE